MPSIAVPRPTSAHNASKYGRGSFEAGKLSWRLWYGNNVNDKRPLSAPLVRMALKRWPRNVFMSPTFLSNSETTKGVNSRKTSLSRFVSQQWKYPFHRVDNSSSSQAHVAFPFLHSTENPLRPLCIQCVRYPHTLSLRMNPSRVCPARNLTISKLGPGLGTAIPWTSVDIIGLPFLSALSTTLESFSLGVGYTNSVGVCLGAPCAPTKGRCSG
jgi:hypothetical protein